MGSYNELYVTGLRCPRCGEITTREIDFREGHISLYGYHVGDEIFERDGEAIPPTREVEGYTDCSVCNKDFWVKIKLRESTIIGWELDLDRPGMIPD
jgi:hypothetical protein